MKIEINCVAKGEKGETCFVHARGAMDGGGRFIITTQPLRLTGCDVFYGMHQIKSMDGGKTWSEITPCKNLTRRPFAEGLEYCMSDATPMFHKKTGVFLGTGHSVVYKNDNLVPGPRKIHILYTVFNEDTQDWEDFRELKLEGVDEEEYFAVGSGCAQCAELPDGDVLIPVYYRSLDNAKNLDTLKLKSAVIRCSFDGRELKFKEIGNVLTIDTPRGLYEPSVVKANDGFFLCLRNDETGYVSKSSDGLHFEEPRELVFDNGENVGNYNTQQHWIRGKDKIYMVYTRRGAGNDHVFRHRAPLFMAEFDTGRMCIVRDTKVIVVPERGARLGNFGCFNVSDTEAYIVASEWMQCGELGWEECAKHGSDNSIFVTKINF